MKQAAFHEEADAEVNEAVRYSAGRAPGLGLTFLEDVEQAVDQVLATPEACQLAGDEVRRKLLRRFPYSLLYVIEADRIRVMAVTHHQRRPGYWISRL